MDALTVFLLSRTIQGEEPLDTGGGRSWLQDTLKRKLVDFAWNRRFFLFNRRVLAFFRVNPLKVLINPIVFIRSACFDQSSGQPRVTPGKQEGGGRKKIQKSASFLFEVSCSQRRVFSLDASFVLLATASASAPALSLDSALCCCGVSCMI